jgi:hypothetical protein
LKTNNLQQEVIFFHSQIFGYPPSEELIVHYCNAHFEISDFLHIKSGERKYIDLIINKKLDALGIEFWTRRFSLFSILTSKLLLISYIAESDGKHSEYYRKNTSYKIKLQFICYALLRIFRGFFQMVRYKIV